MSQTEMPAVSRFPGLIYFLMDFVVEYSVEQIAK